jgi:subtilisin family serine protease
MRGTASTHALPPVRRLPPALAGRAAFSDRRLAVTYDASATGDGIGAIERRNGVREARTLLQTPDAISRVVTIASGHSIDDVRRGLAAERGVRSVERVRLRYPLASTPVYPNDPNFSQNEQWDVFQIGAPAAWGYGRGAKSVAIAVIDTGYDPHQPEVAAQVTVAEKVVGGRIDASAGAAADTDGHGTHLSGIASAATNNAVGWAGIAFGAALQEYKVFSDGVNPIADSTDVAGAIREAVAQKANVILLAVGGAADAGPDPFERDAVNFALANNVVVIAAAGNDGATTIEYPAGYGGVIAVGASALNDAAFPGSASGAKEYVPAYSNTAPGLTLVAPGGDPNGTTDTDQIHWIENAYTTQPGVGTPACAPGTAPAACGALFSGTSVAAAHVAGAAGLLLAKNAALTPAQISSLLSSTADDIGDPKQGSGRLDLRRAMAALANDLAPFPKYTPANAQFIAFAYTNVAQSATKPAIADVTYPRGVRVNADGTFRIADLPVGIGAYRIAVWHDVNGNGTIDAGDYVGVSALCTASGPCAGATAIAAAPVAAGYVLP